MYCKYNPTCHSNLHLRCNAIEVHRNALQIRSSSYSSVECIFHFQMKQIIEMQLISQIHACDAVQLKCIAMHCKSIPTHQSNIYPRYNDQCIVYFQLMLSIEIQVISKSLFFQYNAIEGHHNRNITTHSVWIWVTSLINPHLWCNATHWDLMHCVRFTCYVLLFWPMKRLFFINWPYKTCSRFDTSPKENSPWETYGFPWEKLCHRGRRRLLPRDLTSPKGKKQTEPTSPKEPSNQTICTSPKGLPPNYTNVSQDDKLNHLPRNKTKPSHHLPSYQKFLAHLHYYPRPPCAKVPKFICISRVVTWVEG